MTGATRSLNDPWNAGYLEAENSCGSGSDFALDFDDRGIAGNPSDGTDWGEDAGVKKCGSSYSGESWFVWNRYSVDDVSGSTCETCPAGFFCEGGKIERCPHSTSSAAGATSVANCLCDAAYYDADAGAGVECALCPAGTYGSGIGKESVEECTSCPQGKYNSVPGATSHAACIKCPVGRYGTEDRRTSSAECEMCPSFSGGLHDGDGLTAIEQCTCQAGYYDEDGSNLNPSVSPWSLWR